MKNNANSVVFVISITHILRNLLPLLGEFPIMRIWLSTRYAMIQNAATGHDMAFIIIFLL